MVAVNADADNHLRDLKDGNKFRPLRAISTRRQIIVVVHKSMNLKQKMDKKLNIWTKFCFENNDFEFENRFGRKISCFFLVW